MAQVESKSTTAGSARNGGDGRTPSSDPTGARKSFFAGFGRRSLVDRPTANGGGAASAQPRKRSGMFQFAIGLILFMVGSQVLLYLLAALGDAFHATAFLQSSIAPRNQGVLLLSGLTWFMLFWFVLVALLYYVLIKTKLIPQDPMGVKAKARDQASGRGGASSARGANGSKSSAAIPTVNVRPPTRADRRAAAQERAAREAAAAAKSKKKAGQAVAAAKSEPEPGRVVSGEYDAEYERIKTALRQQRRRGAKR